MTDREKARRRIVGIMNGLAKAAGHAPGPAAQVANEFAKALDVLTAPAPAPQFADVAAEVERILQIDAEVRKQIEKGQPTFSDAELVTLENAGIAHLPIATTQIEAEASKLMTTFSVDRGDLPSQKAGDLAPPNMIYIPSPEENLLELRRAVWAMRDKSATSETVRRLKELVPTDPDVSDCEEVKCSGEQSCVGPLPEEMPESQIVFSDAIDLGLLRTAARDLVDYLNSVPLPDDVPQASVAGVAKRVAAVMALLPDTNDQDSP